MPPTRDPNAKPPPPRGAMGLGNLAQGVRQVSHATSSRQPAPPPAIRHVAPAAQPAFGPIARQTQPLNRAVTQARQQTARAQAQLPRHPQRNPSLPPPKPAAGTPFGRFQGNENLAPIYRARTDVRVNTARLAGYTGSRSQLAQAGAHLAPTPHPVHRDLLQSIGHFFAPLYGGDGGSGAANTSNGLLMGGVGGAVASPQFTKSLGARLPADLAVATVEHPGQVIGHTATGLGGIIAGTPAGLAELAYGTAKGLVHGNLSEAAQPVSHLASAAVQDFNRRYGPLLAGNDKAFQQRIVREGAAPELLDITGAVGGLGAAGGRVVGGLAREGRLGEAARAVATTRPALRISGDLARPQEVSPNFFRATAQHGEDVVRQKVLARRNRGVARPGLQPGPGEVVPASRRLAERQQRITVSKASAGSYIANKREQTAEINQGVERDLAALSHKQRRAVWHTTQGLLPVHQAADETQAQLVERFRQAIHDRRGQIVAHRAANTVPEDPAVYAPTRELQTLDFLDKHAAEILANQKLAGFHASYLDRSTRVAEADPGLNNTTALVRRYRPQAHVLGVDYQPEVRAAQIAQAEHAALSGVHDLNEQARIREQFDTQRQALTEQKPALDQQFVNDVRAKAQAKGLPEPAYVLHGKRPFFSRADRTAANLFRGIGAANKQSDLKLFREGRADTSPQFLIQGLAKNIKRKHQWDAVAKAADQHSFKQFGHGTPDQLQTRIEHAGLNPEDFAYYNPGRLRNVQAVTEGDQHVGRAFDQAASPGGAGLQQASQEFRRSPGALAIPREVYNELKANTQPASRAGRVIGRAQGLQSAAILGLSPSWLQMQVAANTLQSLVGMRGNAKDLLAGQAFGRTLEPAQREALDVAGGIGLVEGSAGQPHMGAYQGRMSAAAERIGQVPVVKLGGRAVRVTDLNPIHAMFRADNAQNNVFRRAVIYNDVKRQAFSNMQRELGLAQTAQARVSQMLKLKPGEDLRAHIDRVLANPAQVEQLATHVNNVLGDYLRYTSKERMLLRRSVMFYGFMRYALKTLFYTLPVGHPLAATLLGKVGQLHGEELRQLFGTRDIPPWVLSRMMLTDEHGQFARNAQGLPESVDLARINPVTTPISDVLQQSAPHVNSKGQATGGVDLAPVLGMASPVIQAALDQAYARNSFTGQGFHVHGSAEDNPSPDAATRGRIVLNQMLASAWPYREAMKMLYRGKQGDDTLLGSPRPIQYKTPQTQAKEAQRLAMLPPRGRQFLQDVAPLVFPAGDTTQRFIATHNKGGAPSTGSAPSNPTQALLEKAQAHRVSASATAAQQALLEQAMQYRRR